MRFKRIHHIGVIVDDLAEASKLLSQDFGLPVQPGVVNENMRAAFFQCGDASIEMIEVLDPAARRARLGAGQRARIEHIAIEVDDLDATLSALQVLGVLPGAPPRVSNRYLSVWTDPDTSDGVMYQFMQKAQEPIG
jgi:methylmalonyl-CoA/ethylmalonyl-CoA epimerase